MAARRFSSRWCNKPLAVLKLLLEAHALLRKIYFVRFFGYHQHMPDVSAEVHRVHGGLLSSNNLLCCFLVQNIS